VSDILSLSTRVLPTRKFKVDGEEYEILSLDHLSRDDEALVHARFSRYGQTATDLSIERDLQKGTQLALSLRKQRAAILAQLTTMDRALADKLPTNDSVKLIEAIQEELSGERSRDDDEEKIDGGDEEA
jgi:hypothetical protein